MTVYIAAWSLWISGLETGEDRFPGSDFGQPADNPGATPPLAHVDAMFKRRLSQLTRMTIHTGHQAMAGQPPMKITFSSVYGEIRQQYKITERLLDDGEVSPAHFSLSVFNTPVAALSITEKNVEGYTACYPGPDAFTAGFTDAAAGILSGLEDRRLFICADEHMPDTYLPISGHPYVPHALAIVLSRTGGEAMPSISLDRLEAYRSTAPNPENLPPALRFAQDILCAGKNRKVQQTHA